jgi:hypothetical protein
MGEHPFAGSRGEPVPGSGVIRARENERNVGHPRPLFGGQSSTEITVTEGLSRKRGNCILLTG